MSSFPNWEGICPLSTETQVIFFLLFDLSSNHLSTPLEALSFLLLPKALLCRSKLWHCNFLIFKPKTFLIFGSMFSLSHLSSCFLECFAFFLWSSSFILGTILTHIFLQFIFLRNACKCKCLDRSHVCICSQCTLYCIRVCLMQFTSVVQAGNILSDIGRPLLHYLWLPLLEQINFFLMLWDHAQWCTGFKGLKPGITEKSVLYYLTHSMSIIPP